MEKNESGQELAFTASENKAMSVASWLTAFYLLFSGLFISLDNTLDKIGTPVLYIFSVLALMVIADVAAYIVLFFIQLRKIRKYRARYCAMVVILFVMGVLITYLGFDYVTDIFCGTQTVTTDEYLISGKRKKCLVFMDNGGVETRVNLSEETAETLDANPYINENPWSENFLFYHTGTITIEYYPHSGVLMGIAGD